MPKPKWATKKDMKKIHSCEKDIRKKKRRGDAGDVNEYAACRASVKKGKKR